MAFGSVRPKGPTFLHPSLWLRFTLEPDEPIGVGGRDPDERDDVPESRGKIGRPTQHPNFCGYHPRIGNFLFISLGK